MSIPQSLTTQDAPTKPSRNNLVDALRAIAIVLVITAHVDLRDAGLYGNILRMVVRWVIPFFFIISGYFAGKKCLSIFNQQRRKSLKRLAAVFIFGNLLYMPLFVNSSHHGTIPAAITHLLYNGSMFHLWFINTLFFGQLVISLPKSEKLAQVWAVGMGIAIAALNCHPHPTGTIECFTRLGNSIPYLALGILLAKIPVKRRVGLACIVVGATAQVADFYFDIRANNQDTIVFVGTALLAFGIASTAISPLGNNLKSQPLLPTAPSPLLNQIMTVLAKIGRDYVLGIYVIHIYVRMGINFLARKMGIYDAISFRFGSILLIFLGSIATIYFWNRLQECFKPRPCRFP